MLIIWYIKIKSIICNNKNACFSLYHKSLEYGLMFNILGIKTVGNVVCKNILNENILKAIICFLYDYFKLPLTTLKAQSPVKVKFFRQKKDNF